MPWLERPAGVHTRHEVVLHRVDDPHIIHLQSRTSTAMTAYEVRELRALFVFDAAGGKWGVVSIKAFGYRRGARDAARIEVPGTTPELREFAKRYVPDWIPDPSKSKTWLPAEDVYDEAIAAVDRALAALPSMTKSMKAKLGIVIAANAANPYRGE